MAWRRLTFGSVPKLEDSSKEGDQVARWRHNSFSCLSNAIACNQRQSIAFLFFFLLSIIFFLLLLPHLHLSHFHFLLAFAQQPRKIKKRAVSENWWRFDHVTGIEFFDAFLRSGSVWGGSSLFWFTFISHGTARLKNLCFWMKDIIHRSIHRSPNVLQTRHREQPTTHQHHRHSTFTHFFSNQTKQQNDHSIHQEENPTPWRHFDLFFSSLRLRRCRANALGELRSNCNSLLSKSTLHLINRQKCLFDHFHKGVCKGFATRRERSHQS